MAKITVDAARRQAQAARDLANALDVAANRAMAEGKHEFDFVDTARDVYKAASSELDRAIADAETKAD